MVVYIPGACSLAAEPRDEHELCLLVTAVDGLDVDATTHHTKQPLGAVNPKTLHESQQAAIPGRERERDVKC